MISNSIDAKFLPTQALNRRKWNEPKQTFKEDSNQPRTDRKRIESFLNCSMITLEPSLWTIDLNVWPPDLRITMDRVTRYTQYCSFREKLLANGESTFGYGAR